MKKLTPLFFFFIINFVSGQSGIIDKQKLSQKDSIKKEKSVTIGQKTSLDSLIIEMGIFKPYKKDAHASYYHDMFNGRKTASGKRFDNKKLTAAHRKLPFGTIVRVTNEANGKFVIVEITDRGPFARGREIDLSKRAFMEITSNKKGGAVNVKLEIMKN